MKEERDILVKQIFPQIRKICEDRAVTFTDIDLRWGINDEQKAEGEVLPICLETIERCRPYFIGILGERYGWIQKTIPDDLIKQELWLEGLAGKSITELEIMHGVLNNPSMKKHALFYLRDPSYVDPVSSEEKEDFIEAPVPEEIDQFGLKKANELAEERRQKLQSLKQEIRNSLFPVTEYMSPKELGEAVLKDLTTLVNEKYPEDTKPDPHEQETSVHEAFARERTRIYIKNQVLLESLDKHAESADQPLVILGESGSGKSALLANWVSQYREKHPDEIVFTHFIGATSTSTDWEAMLRKIMLELKHRFDIQQDIPEDKNELRLAFANWLHMAAAKGRFVLIIDALNQLEDRDGAQDLVWLPPMIPENIRLIVSTLPGRSLDVLKEREWTTLEVPLQDIERRKKLIMDYLVQYGKKPTPVQADMIASYPQTSNPLYLRSLLEELRLYGDHFTVDKQFAWYLEARTVEELFDKILMRWEQDYEMDRPGLVRDAMRYIWASRKGLTEAELMLLLGDGDGQPLQAAYWIPFYLAAEKSLVDRSGLIDFFHDYLQAAVKKRYFTSEEDDEREVRIQIALHFMREISKKNITSRSFYEVPWQLCMAEQWNQLYSLLSNEEWLQVLWMFNEYDVKMYWTKIEAHSTYKIENAYDAFFMNDSINEDNLLILTQLFHDMDNLAKAMELYKKQELIFREKNNLKGLSSSLNNQALVLHTQGKLEDVLELYKQSEKISIEINDYEGIQKSIGNQAMILHGWGQFNESIKLLKKQELICRETNNIESLQVSLGNQALVLQTLGKLEEAMKLHKQEEAICRQINNLDDLQVSLINQASILLQFGKLENAMELSQKAEMICRELNIKDGLQGSLVIQGQILERQGDLKNAMELFNQAETICRKLNSLKDLAQIFNNQASIHKIRGYLTKAMGLHKQEEQICRELNDKIGLQRSLGAQALLHKEIGQLEEALDLFEIAEIICREMNHLQGIVLLLNEKAEIYLKRGQLKEAMNLFEEQKMYSKQINDCANIQKSLLGQALILQMCGQLEEAMELVKQAENISMTQSSPINLPSVLGIKAIITKNMGRLDDAIELNKEVERLGRDLNDLQIILASQSSQAIIFRERGNFDEALNMYNEITYVAQQCENYEILFFSYLNQAEIELDYLGNPQKALDLATKAHHIAEKNKLESNLKFAMELLTRIQSKL